MSLHFDAEHQDPASTNSDDKPGVIYLSTLSLVGHLVNNHVIIEAAKVVQNIIPSQIVLNLLGERKMTGTDVKYVIEQCEPLMRNDTLEVIDKAQAILHESGCDQKYIDSLEKLRAEYRSRRVFKGVDTPYNQIKKFFKTFDLLMPERFGLDHLSKSLRRKKSDGTISVVKDCGR